MSRPKIILAGDAQASAALGSALRERGADALVEHSEDLSAALVDTERSLQIERPQAAVAVGTGDDALALAIAAGKLGVPLAVSFEEAAPEDRRRVLVTLAALDAGAEPARAADVITAWLDEASPRGT